MRVSFSGLGKQNEHKCVLPFDLRNDPFADIEMKAIKKYYMKSIIVSEKHPLQNLYLRSTGAVAFEIRRHILSKSWYVVHPFSLFSAVWQVIVGIIVIPNMINVPWAHEPFSDIAFERYLVFLDLVALANVLLFFFTGYVDEYTLEVVLDHKMIIHKYLTTYFIIDILGAVSSAWLYRTLFVNEDFTNVSIRISIIAIFHVFQLRVFLLYLRTILMYFDIREYGLYIVRLAVQVLMFIHILSCIQSYIVYFVQGTNILNNTESWIKISPDTGRNSPFSFIALKMNISEDNGKEIIRFIPETEKRPGRFYVFCLCRTLSQLFAMGHGRARPTTTEDCYITIIYLLLGRFLLFFLMEKILKFRGWIRSPSVKYMMLMKQVNQYMRRKQLPPTIQSRVRLFYEHRFDKRFFEERTILANLSKNLRTEIRRHDCRRLVAESELFRHAPPQAIERIITRLKHDVYLPNDVLMKAGQYGDCMFFLVSGTVAVLTRAGDEILHLKDGSFFGEMALLLTDERRCATVIAIEVCEVYRLDKEDFQQVMRPMRDLYDHINMVADKRLADLLGIENMYRRLQGTTQTALGLGIGVRNRTTEENVHIAPETRRSL